MPTIRDRNLVATKNGKTNHSDTQSSNTNENLHRNKKQRYIYIYIYIYHPFEKNITCGFKLMRNEVCE